MLCHARPIIVFSIRECLGIQYRQQHAPDIILEHSFPTDDCVFVSTDGVTGVSHGVLLTLRTCALSPLAQAPLVVIIVTLVLWLH